MTDASGGVNLVRSQLYWWLGSTKNTQWASVGLVRCFCMLVQLYAAFVMSLSICNMRYLSHFECLGSLKLMAFEMETDQNKAGLGHRSRWTAGASMTRPQFGHSHEIQNIKILIMACPNVHVVVSVRETS